MIITRGEVRRKLIEWREGQITSTEINEWAGSLYPNTDSDYEDWEGEDQSDSVTNEVLAALDMLNMNLNIPEDADIFIEFLSTPLGQFQEGYAILQKKLDAIDYDNRRLSLRDDQLHAPFLRHGK